MSIDVINFAEKMQCQEVHVRVDSETGFQAIVAIHDTTLGPALGGCRFIEYTSSDEAIMDAIRLARAMSYKAAISDLPLGGGKMVVIKPKFFDRDRFFDITGSFVNNLGGRYITAVDSGTSVSDMDRIATHTQHVTCTSNSKFSNADPSAMSARGVVKGISAAVHFKLGKDSLEGVNIAIQGLGSAGYNVAKQLHEVGAKLHVYDINTEAVKRSKEELSAKEYSSLESLLSSSCEVFAPCALGGVINDHHLSLLKAPIVAGCANNQLEAFRHGEALMNMGILYAPDYVINAGGLIYVAAQPSGISEEETTTKIDNIAHVLTEIFERSERENLSTHKIADTIAEEKIQKAKVSHG